jgi:oxygen-independent coproporphyrinogen-3 oxidase
MWGKLSPQMPTDNENIWFYSIIAERLARAGYHHYEISSWAVPGAQCRHNLGYWTEVPYRGLGLGAHSFIDGKRFWNTRSMSEYQNKLVRGENPIDQIEERTARIRMEEAFLLGLRRMEGFDVWAVAKDIGIDYPREWFDRVDSLVDEGLVEFDGNILKLSSPGWLLATGVIEELLCPALLSICEAIP